MRSNAKIWDQLWSLLDEADWNNTVYVYRANAKGQSEG